MKTVFKTVTNQSTLHNQYFTVLTALQYCKDLAVYLLSMVKVKRSFSNYKKIQQDGEDFFNNPYQLPPS